MVFIYMLLNIIMVGSIMATGFSFVPIWIRMLMLLRQSTSGTIPVWQPIVGLIEMTLFTILCVWIGALIFRATIILQGKRPKLSTLIMYIVKG